MAYWMKRTGRGVNVGCLVNGRSTSLLCSHVDVGAWPGSTAVWRGQGRRTCTPAGRGKCAMRRRHSRALVRSCLEHTGLAVACKHRHVCAGLRVGYADDRGTSSRTSPSPELTYGSRGGGRVCFVGGVVLDGVIEKSTAGGNGKKPWRQFFGGWGSPPIAPRAHQGTPSQPRAHTVPTPAAPPVACRCYPGWRGSSCAERASVPGAGAEVATTE